MMQLIDPSSAQAATPNACTSESDPHDMYVRHTSAGGQIWGIAADINAEQSDRCRGGNDGGIRPFDNFTNAYVMLYSHSGDGWAQAGFEQDDGYLTDDLSQIWDGDVDSDPITVYGAHDLAGTTANYSVVYGRDCQCVRTFKGNTILQTSSFDPTNAWGATGWNGEYAAEAAYPQDDITGTVGNRVYYQNMEYQNSTFTWVPQDCASLSPVNDQKAPPPRQAKWTQNQHSCSVVQTWTASP